MVVDIQGMKSHDGFLLTDPSIHCADLDKYGEGNFGDKGFEEFFKTHQCNQICQQLKLPFHKTQAHIGVYVDIASAIRPILPVLPPHTRPVLPVTVTPPIKFKRPAKVNRVKPKLG